MNKKLKRILSLMMTMVFVLCMMATVGVASYAEGEEKIWYLGWTEGKERYIGWIGNNGTASVDTENYYKDGSSRYSIKMTKKTIDAAEKYNYCYVEKKVTVEPLTTYRFSAMVKYDELPLEVDSGKKLTGASVTVGSSRSAEVKGDSDWTMVSVVFTTKKDQTECVLRLWNGVYDTERSCNGTAWFSDIKLEEATYTNRYNTLVVILKNVDATVDITGMDTVLNDSSDGVVRFQKSFTDSDIEAIKETAYGMRDRMNGYAEGRMVYEDIDFVTVDKSITEDELGTYYQGYMINHYSEVVSDILDQNLAKKNYHQIILYSPIHDITNGWVGLGGTKHNGIRFCQSVCGADFSLEYRIRNMCHEILHCIETDSKIINAELTPDFHAHADFGYANGSEEWKDAYIDASLPGGMGIQPEAYMCISGEWKSFIDDDMKVGGLIDTSALPLDISPVTARLSKYSYTGSPVTPGVILKDGRYTLKKNVDYTISYSNNTFPGRGVITITGKGIYTGTKKVTFKITDENGKFDRTDTLEHYWERASETGRFDHVLKLLELFTKKQ